MDSANQAVLDFEAPKDPGAHRQANAHVTDNEILGKEPIYAYVFFVCRKEYV